MTDRDALSAPELRRYARHIILPEVGEAGQRRLRDGSVLLVGVGGLGSPAALYLTAAGVGTIGLADDDLVDESNLQRQVLHGTGAIGQSKLSSAEARLHDLNPHTRIIRHGIRITSANAREVIGPYDVVIDGSDNFPTRYLVNDACVLERTPCVYGAIFRFEGQVSVFAAADGPCYRCLFRDPPPPELIPSCEAAGVLGVVPGIIGSLQALEAIKLLAGIGDPLIGRLLMLDALAVRFRELRLQRDPGCPVCGHEPSVTSLIDYEAFCGVTQRDRTGAAAEITPRELAAVMGKASAPLVVDVREPWEWAIGHLADSLHVPLRELQTRAPALDSARAVVTVCHHGVRSLTAQRILAEAGFDDVRSLRGGLEAWATEIDASVGRY